jgi:hypothetical protein
MSSTRDGPVRMTLTTFIEEHAPAVGGQGIDSIRTFELRTGKLPREISNTFHDGSPNKLLRRAKVSATAERL